MNKRSKTPQTTLLGSTAAQMEEAKRRVQQGPEAPVEMPELSDPDIIEAQRKQRRMAKKRKGVASTILTGGQLGDEGYQTGTPLG